MDRVSTLVIYQRVLITKIINLKDKIINKQNITKEKLLEKQAPVVFSSCFRIPLKLVYVVSEKIAT